MSEVDIKAIEIKEGNVKLIKETVDLQNNLQKQYNELENRKGLIMITLINEAGADIKEKWQLSADLTKILKIEPPNPT